MAKKKTTKKKVAKKAAIKKTVPAFSKLDPILLLGASQSKVAHKLGIAEKPEAEAAPSVSKVALGIRSLADRMSTKAAHDYVQEDLVSVLIESTDVTGTQRKIKSLGGTSTLLTSNKVTAWL